MILRLSCLVGMFACAMGIIDEAYSHNIAAMLWAIAAFLWATKSFLNALKDKHNDENIKE